MPYPNKVRGTKVCLAVTRDGVTVYGNKAAFKTLAEWMLWIAASDPAEHYEHHIVWYLLNRFSSGPPDVFIRFDKHTRGLFARRGLRRDEQFELTFMQVENADLKKLAQQRVLVLDEEEEPKKVARQARAPRRRSRSGGKPKR